MKAKVWGGVKREGGYCVWCSILIAGSLEGSGDEE